jgi:hypothetical protein
MSALLRISTLTLALLGATAALSAQETPPSLRILGPIGVLGETAGAGSRPFILRGGFPLAAELGLADVRRLVLIDAETREPQAASFAPLSRWRAPVSAEEAPLRWVSITTEAAAGRRFLVADRPAREIVPELKIEAPADKRLRVSGKKLRLEIEEASRSLLREAIATGGGGLRTGRALSLIVEDEKGQPIEVAPWALDPIRSDGQLAEIVARTTFSGLRAELRLRMMAASSAAILDFRILNPGDYGWAETKPATRYLGRVALTLPTPRDLLVVSSDEGGLLRENLGRGLFLLQGHQIEQDGKRRREELRRELWVDGKPALSKRDGRGRLHFATDDSGLQVEVERFRELAPKALGTNGETTVFDFLPRGGSGPAYRGRYGRPNKGDVDPRSLKAYRIEGGRAFSARLHLDFDQRSAMPSEADDPRSLQLVPERGYVAQTQALGHPLPAPNRGDTAGLRFERLMETFVSDAAADAVPGLGRIGLPGFRRRGGTYGQQIFYGWFNFGDIPWGDGYCSLHYDLPYSILLAGLRHQDIRFFALGEDMARHRRDVDQDHGFRAEYRGRGGQVYEKGFWHGNFESPKLSHTWLRGPILHWWLSGDPWSREAAKLGLAFIRRQSPAGWNGYYGARIPGWTLDNLVAAWEAFGEADDLKTARALAAKVAELEAGRGFIVNPANKPAGWKPWMHAILALGVGRLHAVTGAEIEGQLHQRLLQSLEDRALSGGKDAPRLFRFHDGRAGREPSLHLLWPAIAAWSTDRGPDPKSIARRQRTASILRYAIRNHQGRAENPLGFRMQGFPGSESKVMSNIALFGQAGLPLLSRPK